MHSWGFGAYTNTNPATELVLPLTVMFMHYLSVKPLAEVYVWVKKKCLLTEQGAPSWALTVPCALFAETLNAVCALFGINVLPWYWNELIEVWFCSIIWTESEEPCFSHLFVWFLLLFYFLFFTYTLQEKVTSSNSHFCVHKLMQNTHSTTAAHVCALGNNIPILWQGHVECYLRWRHSYGKKFFHKICDSYFCTHEL